jgi:predicted site-specific integrase-resolvase
MEHTYRPHEFAALIGKTVNTLQRWDREGILPAHRTPTNRRYYTHDQYLEYRGLKATQAGQTLVYARVSSASQKIDLQNQLAVLHAYCHAKDLQVDEWVQETGSGLNYQRTQFNRILQDIELGRVQRLIIAHKDRLVRFGFEWFAAFCERHGTVLVIVNGDTLSPERELVQDLVSIIHSFSARLSGLRPYQKVIRDAALQKDPSPGQ